MANVWMYRLKRRLLVSVFGVLLTLVTATVVLTSAVLRDRILEDSAGLTAEIGAAVEACLDVQMMAHDPAGIERVIENLAREDGPLVRAFILQADGRVAVSSEPGEQGRVLDRTRDRSCTPCHAGRDGAPEQVTSRFERDGRTFHRQITVLRNESGCQRCHDTGRPVVGKVVLDRSLEGTDALVGSVQLVVVAAGAFFVLAIALAAPFVSRHIDRYIRRIEQQDSEITLLYRMVEHLSQTIDLRELRGVILRTVRETFDADEVLMVLALEEGERRCTVTRRHGPSELRRDIAEEPGLAALHARWLAGTLGEGLVTADGREIVVPIGPANEPLALMVIRRTTGRFAPHRSRLVRALESHVAVALRNARLYVLAITDELTGLHTSRHLRSCLDTYVGRRERYGERFSLLFLDIDDFKRVNDTHGHVVGDEVLRQLGACIRRSVGDEDLAFRYGGEELVVLLPRTDAAGAFRAAERLRERIAGLREPSWPAGLQVTVSVGVATCPTDGTTARELIERADEALYRAKRTGKNRVVAAGEGRLSLVVSHES